MKNRSIILSWLLFNLLFIYSCHGQQKSITISPEPVFSEADTVAATNGNRPIHKFDYYLVKGGVYNKRYLKKAIDSFIEKKLHQENFAYDDYLMVFYKETPELNKKTILDLKYEYRYKIFDVYKNDCFIAEYNYRDSSLYHILWSSRYDK